MSKKYIFAIGGTGHKIVRSVVHLASAGVYGNDDIYIKMIDSDRTNGNYVNTKETLESYRNFYEAVGGGRETVRFPKIEPMFGSDFLFELVGQNATMNELFAIEHWSKIGDFAKFLFSEDERNKRLDKGFYGRTNIGPIVIENSINKVRNEHEKPFWENVEIMLGTQDDKEVIIVGSVFGGMGASGIPVLLNKLVNFREHNVQNFSISLIVCTPYFKFTRPATAGKVAPNSGAFGAKVRAALKYYDSENIFGDEKVSLYLIGENENNYEEFKYSDGGNDQTNKACPIELFAATAINHRINDSNKNGGIFTSRRDNLNGENIYTWDMLDRLIVESELNADKRISKVSNKLHDIMKAAIVYETLLYREINGSQSASGWLKNYKLDGTVSEGNLQKKEAVLRYFRKLISYFKDIHTKNRRISDDKFEIDINLQVRLFDMTVIESIINSENLKVTLDEFENIIQESETSSNVNIYDKMKGGILDKVKANSSWEVLIERLFTGAKENKTKKINGNSKTKIDRVPYVGNDTNYKMVLTKEADMGFWVRESTDALIEIAKGQNFSARAFTYEEFTVPSPWSAYMAYELILTDAMFSGLNTYAVNTWRGLIALIALRNEEPFKSKLNITISSEIATGKQIVEGLSEKEFDFLHVINGMRPPQNEIFRNENKERYSVVFTIPEYKENGKKEKKYVVAFLSDDIIVTPVTNITSILKDCEIYKFAPDLVDENGYFKTADNFFKEQGYVRKYCRSILYYFLTAVSDYLKNRCGQDGKNQFLKNISNQMKGYKDIIEENSIDRFHMDIEVSSELNSPKNIFDENIRIVGAKTIEYPFEVGYIKYEKNGQSLPVVLCGEKIKGIAKNSPNAYYIYLYGDVLLKDSTAEHFTTGEHGSDNNAIFVLNEADVFLDTMIAFRNMGTEKYFCSENIPNSRIKNEYEIIFPIKKAVVDLFKGNIELLKKNLAADYTGNGFVVKLLFKFADGTVDVLRHEYTIVEANTDVSARKDKAIIFDKEKYLPIVSMYPYTKIKQLSGKDNVWQKYFYFVGKYKSYARGTTDIISIKPNVEFVPKRNESLALDRIPSSKLDKEYRYYSSVEFPLTLEVSGTNSKEDSADIYYGYIFVKQPIPIEQGIENYNVAVDFGTTSSGVFYNTEADSSAVYLQLGNEYRWEMNARSEEERHFNYNKRVEVSVQDLCSSWDEKEKSGTKIKEPDAFVQDRIRYFISEEYYEQKSYLSAYESLRSENDGGRSDAFIYGRMLWQKYEELKDVNAIKNSSFSLKWGGQYEITKKFLRQLFTHISHRLAIGGGLINWKFSYPTSLGRDKIRDFKTNIKEVLEEIKKDVAIEHKWEGELDFVSESISSARYFQSISKLKTFISIDIGGGSTDIALYYADRGIIQTSLKYASRDIFVPFLEKFLSQNSVLFEESGANMASPLARRIKQYNEIKKGANNKESQYVLECSLFEFSDEMTNKYNYLRQEYDKPKTLTKKYFDNFTRNLMIGFSALMYYVAEMIISMILSDRGKKPAESNERGFYFDLDLDQISDITLGFCGKGSKILNWLGDYRKQGIYRAIQTHIYQKLNEIYKNKPEDSRSNILSKYDIKFSELYNDRTTKTETAQGLLIPEIINAPAEIFFNADCLCYRRTDEENEKTKEKKYLSQNEFISANDALLSNLKTYEFKVDKEDSLNVFNEFRNFYNEIVIKIELKDLEAADYRLKDFANTSESDTFFQKVNKMLEDAQKREGRLESTFICAIKVLLDDLLEE